jgi:YD repeat-containing protein
MEQRPYEPAGQPTVITTAGGATTTYPHDPAGNGTVQAFDPTGLDRVTQYATTLTTVDHTTVTGAASPARTERTDHAYDVAGRPVTTTVANPGGTPRP